MIFRPQRHLTLSTFRPSPRNARARAGCIDFIIDKCAPNPPVLVVAGQAQTGKMKRRAIIDADWRDN